VSIKSETLQTPHSALYLDKKTDVDHYMMVMDRLCVHAKPPTETTQFLHNTLQAL
jgi:hypothetical protein